MDSFNRVVWYTVWDAKTEELIASGTAELCARRLGYKNANSFASAVSHAVKGGLSSKKYTFARETIKRSEVDSLPQYQRQAQKRKKPACAGTQTSQKRMMDFTVSSSEE